MAGSILSRLLATVGASAFIGADKLMQQISNEFSLLTTTTASVATAAGTAEQVLATYSLPANFLTATDRKIRVRVSFSAAANGNNKTFKLYAGASVITSGVLTTNAKNGNAEIIMTRTGSKTQIVTATMSIDTTPITPFVSLTAAEDDTLPIVFKFTGTDGSNSAGDIVMNDFFVEVMH